MNQEQLNEIKTMLESERELIRPQDYRVMKDMVQALEAKIRFNNITNNKSEKMRIIDLFEEMKVFSTNTEMKRLLHQGFIKFNDVVYKIEIEDMNKIEEVRINNGIHKLEVGNVMVYHFQLINGKLINWSKHKKTND